MDTLPNELIHDICSFLDNVTELWRMSCASSHLRRVTSFPILSRLGISDSDVVADSVSLVLTHSRSFYLILVVAHICRIQTLRVACPDDLNGSAIRKSASILAVTAPIPDIFIYDRFDYRTLRQSLSKFPQAATDTLLLVAKNRVSVSRTRRAVALTPPSSRAGRGLMRLASAIHRARPSVLGSTPASEESEDMDDFPLFLDWIRIQRLPEKCTSVILTTQWGYSFSIKPIPGVSDSMYMAFLSSLDLGVYLIDLAVEAGSNISYADLSAFVARHECIRHLTCAPNSIRRGLATPLQPHSSSTITRLAAPASYIPHLLLIVPKAREIYIMPHKPRVFAHDAYCLALSAISRLPGSHPLGLALCFDITAGALPWQRAAAGPDAPETLLTRMEELLLRSTGPVRHTPAAIRAFPAWLARMRGLRRVVFAHQTEERISGALRVQLAQAICEVRAGMAQSGGFAFDVLVGPQAGTVGLMSLRAQILIERRRDTAVFYARI
ncbi:hypothetical protein FB45DRAFT_26181 [Roridomyces roridus]|uniref:F-box domain-containing protein n=1 Tax=Roridomyces roridus TaxID=1738132 RepID=A0AAD7G1K6_9AGAR|nr:hypothetical protein FB45DRAFT_26181 [Roridomyces roridus]